MARPNAGQEEVRVKGRPSVEKRRKERARQERKRDKAARRAERRSQQAEGSAQRDPDEDPDIAGIVPGPQPLPFESESAPQSTRAPEQGHPGEERGPA